MSFADNNSVKESLLGDHNPSEIASDAFFSADDHYENEEEEDISKILRNHPELLETIGTIVLKNRPGCKLQIKASVARTRMFS